MSARQSQSPQNHHYPRPPFLTIPSTSSSVPRSVPIWPVCISTESILLALHLSDFSTFPRFLFRRVACIFCIFCIFLQISCSRRGYRESGGVIQNFSNEKGEKIEKNNYVVIVRFDYYFGFDLTHHFKHFFLARNI